VLLGAATVLLTEVLSPCGLLRRGPLLLAWFLIIAAAIAYLWRHRSAVRIAFRPVETTVAAAIAIMAGFIGYTAWLSPPNSADAMAYHMPRVVYWAQAGSVAFYPTSYLNQIMMPPLAEYCMLHTYVISGGDPFINLVTFGAYIGSIIAVSALAAALGLRSRAQAFAALFNGEGVVDPGCACDPGKGPRLRSALAVPLEGLGGLVGTLTLYHSERDAFNGDHLRIAQAISSKLCLTIENAGQYQAAQESALTDELTGLPNVRPLFIHLNQELARCQSAIIPLTVLVLDLDRFKEVNDRFGHLEGNRVLRLVARGLRSSCRPGDFVARMGGDEFVMVLRDFRPEALERRKQELSDMVVRAGREVCGEDILSLSAGDASFPRDGGDAEKLLAAADKRMYQVKQSHHNDLQSGSLHERGLAVA
jgi:diguanylate cyclase (GGDEF)-like protein